MEQYNELQVVEEQNTEVSVVEDEKKSGLCTGAGIVLGCALGYGVYKAYKEIKWRIRKKKMVQDTIKDIKKVYDEVYEEE